MEVEDVVFLMDLYVGWRTAVMLHRHRKLWQNTDEQTLAMPQYWKDCR